MTVEDILPRIRHHQENQERLERAADEARVELDARLMGVQDAEVVATYAREMGDWLLESGLAETKAFLRTFIREIIVRPGHATIHYTVPTPDDSPIGGADVAEVALGRRFMKSVSRREPVEPPPSFPHRREPRVTGQVIQWSGAVKWPVISSEAQRSRRTSTIASSIFRD